MSFLHPTHYNLAYKPYIKKDIPAMSKQSSQLVVNGTRMGETAKAVKFSISDCQGVPYHGLTTWFPFSQVSKSFTSPETDPGKDYLVVSEWIMREKSLLPETQEVKNKLRKDTES